MWRPQPGAEFSCCCCSLLGFGSLLSELMQGPLVLSCNVISAPWQPVRWVQQIINHPAIHRA